MRELADEALRLTLHVPVPVLSDTDACQICGEELGDHSKWGWNCPLPEGGFALTTFVPTEIGHA